MLTAVRCVAPYLEAAHVRHVGIGVGVQLGEGELSAYVLTELRACTPRWARSSGWKRAVTVRAYAHVLYQN